VGGPLAILQHGNAVWAWIASCDPAGAGRGNTRGLQLPPRCTADGRERAFQVTGGACLPTLRALQGCADGLRMPWPAARVATPPREAFSAAAMSSMVAAPAFCCSRIGLGSTLAAKNYRPRAVHGFQRALPSPTGGAWGYPKGVTPRALGRRAGACRVAVLLQKPLPPSQPRRRTGVQGRKGSTFRTPFATRRGPCVP